MKKIILLLIVCMSIGCKKKLDLKPNSSMVVPKTVAELVAILENADYVNQTPAFGQLSADEYFVPTLSGWQSAPLATGRNAVIWGKDIYEGETTVKNFGEWQAPYTAIFIANSVLGALSTQDINLDVEKQRLKGRALFVRSYMFYALVSIYSKGYDANSASQDLGIPLKLNGKVDDIVQRSTVEEAYRQIIADVTEASELLNIEIIANKKNQPSKAAAFAFLARVYLSMRKYDLAEMNADKALAIYSKLTDFNSLNTISNPFNVNSEETIYYSITTPNVGAPFILSELNLYAVNSTLVNLYDVNDLRLQIYFLKNTQGYYLVKPINNRNTVPFSGLATDELYLIKAECLARKGLKEPALEYLNTLLKSRMKVNFFNLVTAVDANEALDKILIERRKALVWRGIRWTDLKRLNLEGKNITITRKIGDETYTLSPNTPQYVLPIAEDEIALTGLQQNLR